MATLLKTPTALADDPARAGRDAATRSTSTRRSPAGAFDGPAARRSATSGRPRRSPTIAASGLRGRGGAGFPTGEKWRTAAATEAPRRYVVANGYGADPASRHRPGPARARPVRGHRGRWRSPPSPSARTEAIIAVRAEDTEAIRRARGGDRRGRRTPGSSAPTSSAPARPVDRRVRPVQGAYMLGEETVLLKALEGKRGQPEQRPPHPAERGLFGMPTVVHNVQTLAARAAGSSATAPRRSPRPARRRARARSSSRSGRRAATASPRSRSGRRCARSSRSAARCRPAGSSRPCSSAGRRAGSCRRSCSTRRTSSSRCARPAPTSARARSSSPTIGPASSTSPGC